MRKGPRLCRGPFSLLVKAGVHIVDVLFAKTVLHQPEPLAEAYKMEITSLQMRHSILMESLVA